MLNTVRRLFLGGMVGKLLGVGREVLAAWLFGTGTVAAAYRLSQAAFLIPLHGFVSDAVSAGFTPNFTQAHKRDPKFALELFSSLHLVLLCVSVIVGVALIAFARPWVGLLAPGFDVAGMELSITLVRILGLSMPAYALVSLYAAVDLVFSGGRIAAARASVQSVGLILGTILAYLTDRAEFIALGFVCAYYVLAGWGIYIVKGAGLRLLPATDRSEGSFKDALLTVWKPFKILIWVPIFLQVNQIIERRVASLINPGAVAAIDYAKFISDTLVVLLAVPFAVAGLSHMATMSQSAFRAEAVRSFRVLFLFGVPVASFFYFHASMFVEVVFMRGSFGQESADLTSAILSAVAPGIVFQLVGYAGSRFLSGRHRNREVLLATCCGIAANVLINVLLGRHLGVATLGWGITANAVIFGWLSMMRIGVSLQIITFCAVLFLGAGAYGVGSQMMALSSPLSVCAFTSLFWITVILAWPPYRREVLALVANSAIKR